MSRFTTNLLQIPVNVVRFFSGVAKPISSSFFSGCQARLNRILNCDRSKGVERLFMRYPVKKRVRNDSRAMQTKGLYQSEVTPPSRETMEKQLTLQVDLFFENQIGLIRDRGLMEAERVLDYGTGNGYFSCKLARQFPHLAIKAIDMREDMIASARKNADSMSVGNIEWAVGDIFDSKFKDDGIRYNGILLRHVTQHVKDLDGLIGRLSSLLKPRAKIWIIDTELDYITGPDTPEFSAYKRVSEGFIRAHGLNGHVCKVLPDILERSGFKVDRSEPSILSLEEIGKDNYQSILHNALLLMRMYNPELLQDGDIELLAKLSGHDVIQSDYHATLGCTVISATKMK